MKIRNRIASLRKQAGLSQTELADLIGATLSMVGKIERGERALNSQWLAKISRALKCAPEELIREEDQYFNFGVVSGDGSVSLMGSEDSGEWKIPADFQGLASLPGRLDDFYVTDDGSHVVGQAERFITCQQSLGLSIPAGSRLVFSWQGYSHPPTVGRLSFIGAFTTRGYRGVVGSVFPGTQPGRFHIMTIGGDHYEDASIDVMAPISAIIFP